jgi:lysylphosphatidylglycerol synthetase-like protein (DUF2156 family)
MTSKRTILLQTALWTAMAWQILFLFFVCSEHTLASFWANHQGLRAMVFLPKPTFVLLGLLSITFLRRIAKQTREMQHPDHD